MLSCSTGFTIHQGDQPFQCCSCHSLWTPGPLDGGYNPQWGSFNYFSCSCPERMGLWAFRSLGKQQLCSRCTCAVNDVWPDAEGLQHSSPSLAPPEVTPPSFHVQIITVASLPFCYLCSSIYFLYYSQTLSLVVQMAKNLSAMQETWVWSLVWEYAPEKGMATHSSILAWRIQWTEETGGLYGPWGHKESDWATNTFTFIWVMWIIKVKLILSCG